MIYYSQKKNGIEIKLRDLESGDIESILNYWFGNSPEFFEKMGIDMTRFPDRETRRTFFIKHIGLSPKKDNAFMMVGESEGKVIGYLLFNCIVPGIEAQVHLHLIDPDYRSKGIASACFSDVIRILPDLVGVKKFIMEPSAGNRAVNSFVQRFGLRPKKTYLKPAQGICREMVVNRYEVSSWLIRTCSFFFSLYRKCSVSMDWAK